jgi:hypothetical protein
VQESIDANKRWRKIRILGGEPTLHPRFNDIMQVLLRYRAFAPGCSIQLVSNGNGKKVQAVLAKVPPGIEIENTAKQGNFQPSFGAFNMAPEDDPRYDTARYANGCEVMSACGMGLGPGGYYQCAVAAGIDRVLGVESGRQSLVADHDDMHDLCEKLCRLCGHFKEGHMVPGAIRTPLLEEKMSPGWERIYADWDVRRRQSRTPN